MLSNKIKYYVKEITDTVIDVNGFKYQKCVITVPGNVTLSAYISVKFMGITSVGCYYHTNKAYVTSMEGPTRKNAEVVLRIDVTTISKEKSFNKDKETIVRVNALLHKSDSNKLEHFGPMNTPVISTTAVSKNEWNKLFYILVIGFCSKAKLIDKLEKSCYADITGVLSRRNPDKPCYIIVKDIHIWKEVK